MRDRYRIAIAQRRATLGIGVFDDAKKEEVNLSKTFGAIVPHDVKIVENLSAD